MLNEIANYELDFIFVKYFVNLKFYSSIGSNIKRNMKNI